MSTLYIVATPIGNLKDITLRALEVLARVDLILCEDTRVTKRLLDCYQIKTATLSYHQHSQLGRVKDIIDLLKAGKDLALVSDAGTPGIADPGNKLVELVVQELGDKVKIVSLPGPSALVASVSISGLAMDRFLFLGFLPTKNKRNKLLREIVDSKYPVVFYESSHRLLKTLSQLEGLIVEGGFLVDFVICRELTKKFETIYRGKIGSVLEMLKGDNLKGEFVVILFRR